MTDMRGRALKYLRAGAVRVLRADSPEDGTPPHRVMAQVVGHQGTYIVDYGTRYTTDPAWSCTCRKAGECAHVAAVALVTGHPSAAARDYRRPVVTVAPARSARAADGWPF